MTLLDFIYNERLLTITVICSILTFQVINVFKTYVTDPLFDFIFPHKYFDFMKINLKNISQNIEPMSVYDKNIDIDLGLFLREFIKYLIMLYIFYILSVYTKLPNETSGNPGVAIM